MQFVGYMIDPEGKGTPLAASSDRSECFGETLRRLTEFSGGDFWFLANSQMAVQERDMTPEEGENLNTIIEEWFEKIRNGEL